MSIKSRRVVASIEARMTSTRLPGKILKPCLGKPMLELMVERVRCSKFIDEIVVATTTNKTDDVTADLASKLKIGCYRGSESDVVGRVTGAMASAKADIIVQLTGDCPIIDPEIIDQLVELFCANDFDLVSNIDVRAYPKGLDVQVATLPTLDKTYKLCSTDEDREHLFFTARKYPEKFRRFNLLPPPELCHPLWRWTLDTQEDYEFLSLVFEQLYQANPKFTSFDVARWMASQPNTLL